MATNQTLRNNIDQSCCFPVLNDQEPAEGPFTLRTFRGKERRAMLQLMQRDEAGYADVVRRHAMLLQQRMFGKAEGQVKSIVDQFLKSLEVEREKFDCQIKFGEENKFRWKRAILMKTRSSTVNVESPVVPS